MFAKLRENPETTRVGLSWTKEEHRQLLDEIDTDLTLEQIAQRHQRTPGAILQRLLFETWNRVHLQKILIDEACEAVGVIREDYDIHEKKRTRNQQLKKAVKPEDDNSKILMDIQESLKSISHQLKILTEKIK
jgi:hypothetical protein